MPALPSLWNEEEAKKCRSELELLVYRSRLLGAEPAIVNWRGGNTSTKSTELDHRGRPTRVLWVKGSGSDLATCTVKDFAGLRQDDLVPLEEKEVLSDEEMVAYVDHCVFKPGGPRQSVEVLMHAFIPFPHVDHTHPDAILAFGNALNGEELARRVFGNRLLWVPYVRPGFPLAKKIAQLLKENPKAEGAILQKHGFVCWGETHRESYENTVRLINEAQEAVDEALKGKRVFGGFALQPLDKAKRSSLMVQMLPVLRGAVSKRKRVILHYDDSDRVLEFTALRESQQVSMVGSACPDHLVHTKHYPLWIPISWDGQPTEETLRTIRQLCDDYAVRYEDYYKRTVKNGAPMHDPYQRITLFPGLGLVATGRDKFTALQSALIFHRAIEVMKGTWALDQYTSLSDDEASAIEYWPLELYKLRLAPPEKELSRRIAVVTGGAGGIGRAIAMRLAEEGAHVVVTDLDEKGAEEVAGQIVEKCGPQRAIAIGADMTDEESVRKVFQETVLTYGGLDILVCSVGLALAKTIDQTTVADWHKLMNVLALGYFLPAREAFRILKAQGIGGSIVFITSKNALVASKGAAVYNAAKAAEAHLARSLAEEGGSHGIRVNCVAPDAVLEGSRIWSSEWRQQRAREYGIDPSQLEEFYRNRTVLKVNVYPSDVAEAVLWLVSDRSSKTTGCTITVDGGVTAAYVR
ncbi:MAG: bifunctional rhamnulose-1-phosphate aldolase/short-chain dehydrogenase [Armatimonadetes bacterium]|nr:bifunctional rhamnulose-1-phosphate aldolase/short-chain dehydrogenase [Armatimonadota bacterium]MDW8120858.1 bifunctional rhamnulose-1-phosphate aldolase/short-chain dehydrogenase [Armatimonadota bacterium]